MKMMAAMIVTDDGEVNGGNDEDDDGSENVFTRIYLILLTPFHEERFHQDN